MTAAHAQPRAHTFQAVATERWFWLHTGLTTRRQRSREMAASRKADTNMLRKKTEVWAEQRAPPSSQLWLEWR